MADAGSATWLASPAAADPADKVTGVVPAGPYCQSGYHCLFYSDLGSLRAYFKSDKNFVNDTFANGQTVNDNSWSASNSSTGGYESHYYYNIDYGGGLVFPTAAGDHDLMLQLTEDPGGLATCGRQAPGPGRQSWWPENGTALRRPGKTVVRRSQRGRGLVKRRPKAAVDPLAPVEAIDTAQAEREAACAARASVGTVRALGEAEVYAMIDSLGDVGATLKDTTPAGLCVDEFGPLNLQPRKGKPGVRRQPLRRRAVYHRHHGVMHI